MAVLVLIAVAGLGFLVTSPEGLRNQYSDLVAQSFATQQVFHDEWSSGRGMPVWRSDQLSGAPALTNPQSTYTHPLHWLFAISDPTKVVGLVFWLEMLLAAMGAYYAASVLKLSSSARLLVAVATLFSFKTILAVYAGWLPVLASIAALPFLFGAALAVVQRPSAGPVLALGSAGTLALHAGHPQLVYYAVLFAGVWLAITVSRLFLAGQWSRGWRTSGALAVGAAVAVGLSAYRVWPIALDVEWVTRSSRDWEFFVGSTPFPGWGLLTLFQPEFFGTPLDGSLPEAWEYVLYLGIVPTVLGVLGGVWGRQRPHVTALRLAVLVSAALAVDSPVLRAVAGAVPGYTLFRLPARMLFLTAFFAFCLAGIGLDEVLKRVPNRVRRATVVILIALTALEGAYWARRYLRAHDPVPVPVRADYQDALRSVETARVASLSPTAPLYGFAAHLGLQLVTGYDPFNFRHYQAYMDVLRYGHALPARSDVWITLDRITRWDMLDALNVQYVASPEPLAMTPPGYALEASFVDQPQFRYYEGVVGGPVFVYRNNRFLRRAFFVSAVTSVSDEPSMVDAVLKTDLRHAAVVMNGPGGTSAPTSGAEVDVLDASGGRLSLRARTADRRFLLVSEVWHPGWRATVDGQPAPLLRADIALQGLWLEPGAHQIELRFWPPGLSTGLIVSGVTACLVLVCLGVLAVRGRRTWV